jgi:hypothetical protein
VTALEGVYRSRDEGSTFESSGKIVGTIACDGGARPFLFQSQPKPAVLRWNGSAFAPAQSEGFAYPVAAPDGTLFASGQNGLVRSIDDGATWISLPHKAGAIHALSSQTLLVISSLGSVDRSSDGGQTWTTVLDSGISDIARAPDGSLTALSLDGHLRRSTDGGATWTDPIGDPPGQNWFSVIVTAAGTWAVSGRAVYSVENGVFRLATTGMGGLAASIYRANGFLYGATDIGLYRSRSGQDWELVLGGPITLVTFHPSIAGTMFAGTWTGTFRSNDSGATWSPLAGAKNAPFVAPGGTTWYVYYGGLWRSDDAGASWKPLWTWDVGRPAVLSMTFDGDAILFGSGGGTAKVFAGLFRSDDRGVTYRKVGTIPGTADLVRIGPAVIVPSNVSRSDDFGQTFTPLFPDHPDVTWVASDGNQLLAVEQQFGVRPPAFYRSLDAGATWTRCLSGLDRFYLGSLEIDGATVYAATDHGIWRSTNVCH